MPVTAFMLRGGLQGTARWTRRAWASPEEDAVCAQVWSMARGDSAGIWVCQKQGSSAGVFVCVYVSVHERVRAGLGRSSR